MNIDKALLTLVVSAASGMSVAVNASIEVVMPNDGSIIFHSSKAQNIVYQALRETVKALGYEIHQLRTPYGIGVKGLSTGSIIVFSRKDGKNSIPGYYDIRHEFMLTIEIKDMKRGEVERKFSD